jgi:hypothetical protein
MLNICHRTLMHGGARTVCMYDLRRFPHAQLPGVRGQHRKRMGQSGGSEEESLSVGSFRRSIRYVGQDGAEDTHAHTSVLRRQVMSSVGLCKRQNRFSCTRSPSGGKKGGMGHSVKPPRNRVTWVSSCMLWIDRFRHSGCIQAYPVILPVAVPAQCKPNVSPM